MATISQQIKNDVTLFLKIGYAAVLILVLLLTGCGTPHVQGKKDAKDMPDALVPVEVDLGKFECTIPNPKTNSTILVDFHAFLKLPRYKSYELEPILKTHENRFRHSMVLRIRKFNRTALNEPDLTQLREALKSSIDELLPDSKIEMIGFYSFQFVEE
ncbi:hypothetical protein [Blastopirellula marina]|uniref:Flagellar protein FliL n=1 Tax=Blastopirellula marina TaxID=124 RepID=A0A2S8FLA0_9BACT|nr:hypothetical protein [Blastopirellula marina]PQO32959.1 hypothetical protein C5Y98_17630 [Blastopirellula marina]PTL43126.1 hypothetical protein C5Y97_17640 [Blastopirellula marina]